MVSTDLAFSLGIFLYKNLPICIKCVVRVLCCLSEHVLTYTHVLVVPAMLNEAIDFLESKCSRNPTFTYEIIVVDDGSKDKTSEVSVELVLQ